MVTFPSLLEYVPFLFVSFPFLCTSLSRYSEYLHTLPCVPMRLLPRTLYPLSRTPSQRMYDQRLNECMNQPGGGGCVVSLLPPTIDMVAVERLKRHLADAHGFGAFVTTLGREGVKLHLATPLETILMARRGACGDSE